MPQPGFLDLDNRYAKLDGGGDPLVKIKSNIIMPTELPGNRNCIARYKIYKAKK